MKREIEEASGIPGIIGIVDGSLIQFSYTPKQDARTWYTRKKFPGINIQATVDNNGAFTSYQIGHPGSVPDVTVFKTSHLWRHRPGYFGPGEKILADKGYPITPYTLRPFAENEMGRTAEDKSRRRKFNKKLSGQRVIVENAFGWLKGRFPCLKLMGPTVTMKTTFKADILLHFGDTAGDFELEPIDDDDDEDGDGAEIERNGRAWMDAANQAVNSRRETDVWMKGQGRQERLDLLDRMFPAGGMDLD